MFSKKRLNYLNAIALLLIISSNISAQNKQNTSLKGSIKDKDLDPIANVTIKIDQESKIFHSDADGNYSIPSIQTGVHRFLILNGRDTIFNQDILVENQLGKNLDIVVDFFSKQLEEVVVNSGKPRYAQTSSDFIAKLPLKNLENPQSYSTINRAVIQEQVIMDFSDVLKNATGVYKVSSNRYISTGGGSQYTIRGFNVEATMVDGIPTQTNAEYDPSFVERVEVLKGPSATLYGGVLTSFGGLVNIVTKRPKTYSGGEVNLTIGSFGMNRASVDLYGPLNKEKTLLYRTNAAFQYQKSFQDAGFKRSFFIAQSFRYQPNERLFVDIDFNFNSTEGTNPLAIFLNRTRKLIATTPDALNFNWERSLTSNDITIKTPTINLKALINYKLCENWTSQTIIASNTRRSNGYYQYEFMRMATDDSLQRTINYQNTANQNIDIQQNFIADFKIGRFRNRFVGGIDYLQQNINNEQSPYIIYDTIMGTANTSVPYRKLMANTVDAALAKSTLAYTDNRTQVSIYSAYVSDVFNFTENFSANVGLRLDRYTSKGTTNNLTNILVASSKYNQTAFSPKFGLVYEIIKNKFSVFANYLNGFSNVSPVSQPLPEYSGVMKPQQAKQYEGGMKFHLLSGKLDISTSYYDIKVSNMLLTTNVEKDGSSYAIYVQDGTQRSRGFEFDLTANPLPGLNILAGYGYNNSKFVESAPSTYGLRPNSSGPANLANLWISQRLLNGTFKGLGIGFGGNYIGKNYSVNTTTIGSFVFPEYTLLNASIFYDIQKLHIALKLNNITDKIYFSGQTVVSPQMRRNMLATIGYTF